MPEYPIRDSILSSMTAQEPWPDNVKLFQPYEVEQILLPDNASCLAVQAFLKMCNLPFEVEMRWNAEFMSPSGRVPFIKCGAFVVSELEPIAQFAANKGVSLCAKLGTEEKAEMRAYMSLITNVLVNAELYISWIDNETFNQVTKVRNSSVYPWPLGWLQTRAKRNNVAKRLKALHWHDKTLDQVLADVEQCCNSLSQRLGDKDYFFGTPTPLDALVYGHIRALLSAHGPKAALMLRPITTSLLRLVVRMTQVTGMKLTPQEEYLLHEAFLPRRRGSQMSQINRDVQSERSRRSQFSVRRPSFDNVINSKPFANKKLIIMTSKRGSITCKYDDRGRFAHYTFKDEDEYSCIMEVIIIIII
ncbi:outer mitochondrial membrane transport complex protein domain-containing protein [Phthorimaea operculella]|nr:outer mitochondrial membrane transport complex protein domain-containing protein [Phthorimaea operculella]